MNVDFRPITQQWLVVVDKETIGTLEYNGRMYILNLTMDCPAKFRILDFSRYNNLDDVEAAIKAACT